MSQYLVVEDRIYVDAAGKVVDVSDPSAARLLATPGDRIPIAEAEALGLVKAPRKQAAKAADKSRKAPARDKSRKAPASSKSKPQSED